jgi:signal transduction histidine kinase
MLGLTLLLAVVGGAALSMGVLSRIQAINTTAEAIIGGDINSRIPLDKTGDELDRLSVTLNRMLDRITHLMEALRQVSSNIAHDLRTPLGRLRHTLDEAREKARTVDDYKLAVTTAISDTDLVLETFSALLRIAQIESGSRRAGFRQLDMAGVVESVVQTYQLIAEDSGRHLEARAAPGVTIAGDHELLTQLLVNLVENAIRHTPPGSTIRLDLIAAPLPELVVSDNGPGIPEGERARVLARFHRLENSRTSPGSGLGLSIVAAIAELHDINLTLEDNAPGLRVRLRLPRSAEKSFAPAAVAAD